MKKLYSHEKVLFNQIFLYPICNKVPWGWQKRNVAHQSNLDGKMIIVITKWVIAHPH